MWLLLLALLPEICLSQYAQFETVKELTPDDLKRLEPGVWLVQFYSPSSPQSAEFAEEYNATAQTISRLAKSAVIDGEKYQRSAKKHGVKKLPAFILLGLGSPKLFVGEPDRQALVDFVFDEIRAAIPKQPFVAADSHGFVIRLRDSTFDNTVLNSEMPWLVAFYTPWCVHCKDLEPEWAAAAEGLKGKVNLGILDATFDTIKANEYDITGYPTIKYFPPGKKTKESAENYEGERTTSGIIKWADIQLKSKEVELLEITSEAQLKKACGDVSFAVVAFLPKLLDCQSECRNGFLATIRSVGVDFLDEDWCWLWSAQGAQEKIEAVLDVGTLGYPAMAVVDVKKVAFFLLDGPFSYEGIKGFLTDVRVGKGKPNPIKQSKLPKIATIQKWDGKDADVQIREDEDQEKLLEEVAAPSKDEL